MSTAAHSMLNRFSQITNNSTAPPPAGSNATSVPQEPSKDIFMLTSQAIEELLSGIPDSLLPPLALADGGNAFDGDATNDWFYPGRSLRNGTLPEVDLVEVQVMEFSALS
ncbi:MAG: hypothetical protein U0103_14605 [Candidatus Obscuribacterales bacterium]